MNELPTVLGIVPLVPIVIFCYLFSATLKAIKSDAIDRFIPILSGLVGGIVAIVILFTIPGYLSATNWIDAFATGAASGLVAVGINQIYKQLSKKEEDIALPDFFDDGEDDEDVIDDEVEETEVGTEEGDEE